MSLKLIKNFTVTNGAYANVIDSNNPLTITQDGGVDDITQIPATTFYMYNDGMRRDSIFDPPAGTSMQLTYTNIVLTPKPFTTTVKTGTTPGTGTKIYLTEVSKTSPTTLNIGMGTVLVLHAGADKEEVLVTGLGGDGVGSYVNVVRNYKASSTTGSALDIAAGSQVEASVKHIYLSKTSDFSGAIAGASLSLSDVANELTTPNATPSASLYQSIYTKAVPQLNKSGTGQQYIPRIPTQYKTDVYFEIAYRELPR